MKSKMGERATMRIRTVDNPTKRAVELIRKAAKFAGAWGEPIEIQVVAMDSLRDPKGRYGFGVFVPDLRVIYIATDIVYRLGGKRGLLEVFFHEWAHYEQHKSGKRFHEGVAERRAKKLTKEFLEEEHGR